MPSSLPRAGTWVLVIAVAAYLNSLGNDFAYDDLWFIVENEVVTEARFSDAFTTSSWPGAREGTGNYRPLVLASFALEWAAFDANPFGFHVVSVLTHALASVLVLLVIAQVFPVGAAFVGAAFFAVHPVHVEAVANVMGRSELYAGVFFLVACLLYLRVRPSSSVARGARLIGLIALFGLALGAKEIAITLPGILFLLELFRTHSRTLTERLRAELPTYAALAGTLAIFVLVRGEILGTLVDTSSEPGLASLTPWERRLTALTVWPQYLRLMVFPLDLAADYAPGVLLPARGVTPAVMLGALLLAGLLGSVWALRRRAPGAALGLAWFFVAVLPVSNLVIRVDVLLAERTLYLPSVGAALVVAAIVHSLARREALIPPRVVGAAAVVALAALMTRTVARNPTWSDTYSMLNTLALEHPESWVSLRGRAAGLERVGNWAEAERAYDLALDFAPDHYQLLVEVARFKARRGSHAEAERLLGEAVRLLPGYPWAYVELAEQRLRRSEGRGAHAAALQGLARSQPPHRDLWAALSESYVLKGDFPAAIRARETALSRDPQHVHGWNRLADLLVQGGRQEDAGRARARAEALAAGEGVGS